MSIDKKSLKYELKSIDELIPYARNARTHTTEQIAKLAGSIKEFGFINPVVISEDGGILAGHGRVMAAQKLGITEIPCVIESHLTDTQKRAYILADNRLALDAGWDDEMLRVELTELESSGYDIETVGFNVEELNKFLKPDFDVEDLSRVMNDNDSENEKPESFDSGEETIVMGKSKTQPGEVWILGNNELKVGDVDECDSIIRHWEIETGLMARIKQED